jgi:GWxTD domain-containing protein
MPTRSLHVSLRIAFLHLLLATQFALVGQSSQPPKPAAGRRMIKDGQPSFYKLWLEQDVPWIITDDEKAAFKQLKTDQERDQFIEAFWQRRGPTPDTEENEFEEEHYHRIIYANEHFAAGIPGWKSDRGRIYIMYGKPDEIDSHPSGGIYERPIEEGGGETSTFAFEVWHYRYLEGVGQDVDITFVDDCRCGNYEMTLPASEKDALLYIPGNDTEKRRFVARPPYFRIGSPPPRADGPVSPAQFQNLEKLLNAQRNNLADTGHNHLWIPINLLADSTQATDATSLVSLTVSATRHDFARDDGGSSPSKITWYVYGRITTLTGHLAKTFTGTIDSAPAKDDSSAQQSPTIEYKTSLPLPYGRYRLEVAVQNTSGDRTAIYSRALIALHQ